MRLRGRLLALFLGLGSAAAFAQATPPMPLSPDVVAAAIAAAKAPAPPAAYVLKGAIEAGNPQRATRSGSRQDARSQQDSDVRRRLHAIHPRGDPGSQSGRCRSSRSAPRTSPAEIQDSLTYVAALPWERTDVTGPDRLVDTMYVIVTPPGSTDRAQIVQPVWVKPETTQLRNILGPSVPERAMLAAFAPDAIQAGKEIVIVYAGTVYAQRVEIRPEDIAAWR